ncbi:guanylate cyclase 32E-like [Littorina saxatilis]|uniref:guanylate cyclase 32E-like n=1 Tax=Littorina saxatilis TaxID=31220 RepID=UPI0038B4B042
MEYANHPGAISKVLFIRRGRNSAFLWIVFSLVVVILPSRSFTNAILTPRRHSSSYSPSLLGKSNVSGIDPRICKLTNVDPPPNRTHLITYTSPSSSSISPSSSASSPSSSKLKKLVIGYLPIEDTCFDTILVLRQFRVISGALTYAIEDINKNRVIPGYELHFVWNDTHGSIAGNLRVITDMWRRGVDVFLGPEETCNHEGRVAAAWNLPMLSYKCADDEVSDKTKYPTFARTRPPAAQVTTSIVSLLLHFNWTRFSIIVGSSHGQQRIAKKLQELAKQNNLTVNHEKQFTEPHMSLMAGNPFPEIVQQTFVDTRVYVFLGQLNAMVDMMTNLNDRGLLITGDYVVIFIDQRSRTVEPDPLKYFKRSFDTSIVRFRHGERALLVVKPTAVASTTNSSRFHEIVRYYNSQPPFEFFSFGNLTKLITDYAAYLYDAVLLYAKAVRLVIDDGGNVRNGTAIINKIRGRSYKSVLGYNTRIDENGDAAGHFTLLAFKEHQSEFTNFSMRPVAQFEMSAHGDRPTFKMFDGEEILWIRGVPPVDEPPCGYRRERCIPPKSFVKEIALGVLGGVILVLAVIALVVYRNWRYEQEIDGLLWKIEFSCIQMSHSFSAGVDNDKPQINSGAISIVSAESRNSYTQVFAQTGFYKGQTVALKLYDKQKVDLGRLTKKEMKLMRDLRHNNINTFIGASVDSDFLVLVTEYCAKGSLTDVLENEDISLDEMFISSLVKDLLQGMIYLHDSVLQHHGGLKSSNCLITSRWTLQVGDFGLLDTRAMTYKHEDVFAYYRNLLWKAPELLRSSKPYRGTQKGDVYSFGIILHEMFGRTGPYGHCKLPPKEIVENVKNKVLADDNPFRPETSWLKCNEYVISCMQECWAESPDQRPDFKTVWHKFKPMRAGMKRNIFDHMMGMMEKYQERLEELVEERTLQLVEEKKKVETLLLRMLPTTVAETLKRGESVIPEAFDSVTIYFSDICGFTKLSAESTPMQVVDMLNDLYTAFDSIVRHYDVYKVETIGDAYMVVSGLPLRNGDLHAGEVASMSLDLLTAIKTFRIRHKPKETLKLRIGIHSGPCVAGVVGLTMPRYTLFGDTVNTASRMETNGEALKVHCSSECRAILEKLGGYTLDERGLVSMKGKGEVLTYWLTGEDPDVRKARLRSLTQFHFPANDVTDSANLQRRAHFLGGSSPHHTLTHAQSPHHSPMLGSVRLPNKSCNKVRLADSSSPPVVFDLFKDSDSGRFVNTDGPNGITQYRGRMHSFKDVMSKTRSKMTPTSSEPVIHDNPNFKSNVNHLAVPAVVGSAPSEISVVFTPVLKGRRRDHDCVSIYDNATPTELSVLLGERTCVGGLDEEREYNESSFSRDAGGSAFGV